MAAICRSSARAALAVAFAFAALALPLAGCASKIAESSPGPFSTLDGKLAVNELDAVQSGQLCMDVQLYAATALTDDQVRDYRCAVESRLATQGLGNQTCSEIFRYCEEAARPRPPIDYGSCGTISALEPFCQMTVAGLGACIDSVAHALLDAARQRDLSCATRDPNPLTTATASAVCRGCTLLAYAAGELMSGATNIGSAP